MPSSSRLTFFSGLEDSHVVAGGYKEMSSMYLGGPIAPSYDPKCGGRLRGLSQ